MDSCIEIERSFTSMNTAIKAVVHVASSELVEGNRALEDVKTLFEALERDLSRFSPGSELSRLNHAGGRPFKASPILFDIIGRSLQWAEATGGVFDPTILPCLVACGYESSFEKLAPEVNLAQKMPERRHTWRDVRLDPESLTVTMQDGCSLDLGGIAKGWAADLAGVRLHRFARFAVDAGGDIAVGGSRAVAEPWPVAIADPFSEDADIADIQMTSGAICTSSTLRRRWRSDESARHHIIDPRTCVSADSGVVAATVIAECAVTAEVLAKATIVLGADDGIALVKRHPGSRCVLMLEGGRIVRSSGEAQTNAS